MEVFQIMGFDLPRDGWDGWFLSVFPQNCLVEWLDGGRESRVNETISPCSWELSCIYMKQWDKWMVWNGRGWKTTFA